jgi:hypothetical protein
MTKTEQVLQITEVITNLGKDLSLANESKTNASPEDLPIIEQNIQYLETVLQDHKDKLQELISE